MKKVMFSESKGNMLHGMLLIALFSCSAFYLADIPFVKELSLSPLIVGILLGMLYANSLRNRLPETYTRKVYGFHRRLLHQKPSALAEKVYVGFTAEPETLYTLVEFIGAQP